MKKVLIGLCVLAACQSAQALQQAAPVATPSVAASAAAVPGISDYLWAQIKTKLGVKALWALAPYVARPTVRAFISYLRNSDHDWLRAEDQRGDMEQYLWQGVQFAAYPCFAAWLFAHGFDVLHGFVKSKSVARGLQIAGLAWSLWQWRQGPAAFAKRVVLDGYRPGFRVDAWRNFQVQLPNALVGLCRRLRTRAGDAEFFDCKGAMLLTGTASDEQKYDLIHAMAHEIGTTLVFRVSYYDILRELAFKSAEEVIDGLFDWTTRRAAAYDQPLAIVYIVGFDRWLADQESPRARAALQYLYRRLDRQMHQFGDYVRADTSGVLPAQPAAGKGLPHIADNVSQFTADLTAAGAGAALSGEEYQMIDLGLRSRVLVVGVCDRPAEDREQVQADLLTECLERASCFKQFKVTLAATGEIGMPVLPDLFADFTPVTPGSEDPGICTLSPVFTKKLEQLPGPHPWQLDMLLDMCKDPKKYPNPNVPPNLLFYGPPGSGKTTLAAGFAGSLGERLLDVDAAKLVTSKNPAHQINRVFEKARLLAATNPSGHAIIFIDEIGTIVRPRSGSNPQDVAAVDALLKKMEGFAGSDSHIIVLATSNTPPEKMEAAFVRPGRFSDVIEVAAPSPQGVKDILRWYIKSAGSPDLLRRMSAEQARAHNFGWVAYDTRQENPVDGRLTIEDLDERAQDLTPAEIECAVVGARNIAVWQGRVRSLHDIARELQKMQEHRHNRAQVNQPREHAAAGPA